MKKLSNLTGIERNKLFSSLRTSITHHSSAIEGISLSYGETKTLLETGKTANNKPLHEQLVVLGFADAFDYVVREASNKVNKITTDTIKDIHGILFEKALQVSPEYVARPVGAYRTTEVSIQGVEVKLSNASDISFDIETLVSDTRKVEKIKDIARWHIDFERVHPFADGNGRVGRLLMTYQCIQNDIVPPLIRNEQRAEYLNSLIDEEKLEYLLKLSIENSYKLLYERERVTEMNKGDLQ